MENKWLKMVALVSVLMLLAAPAPAQIDSDGDLNADSADPAPLDPLVGGIYFDQDITYDVLLAGNVDATGETGNALTIAADGITFDGNGYTILAPDASAGIHVGAFSGVTVENVVVVTPTTGLYLYGVTNSTIRSVTCTGEGSRGIEMRACDGNTIENSTFTGRYYGILMYVDGCTNNIIQNNDLSGSVGYAISEQTAESPSHSNRYINNDCSGSNIGFAISNPAEVTGNNLNSCVLALSFSGYDPATWALTVSDILDGVDLNGSRRAIHLSNVAAGTVIEGLDFSGMDLVNALEVSYSDNITLQNLVVPASNNGLYLYGVTNSTIRSVTCTGEGSRGIEMRACDGNTIENCTFTGRYYGILMYVDGCTNNIIQNNDLSGSVGYAISEQTAESPSHSNRYINNDCSGSNIGFAISNPAEVTGNNLNSCVLALSFSGYDPATWALTVSDILDGVDLNGSRRAIHLSNVAAGTVIEGLDFSGMDLVNALEVSYSDNITLQNLVVPASNNGLYLYGVTNSTIRSVTCTGEGSRGIEMRACDGNTIENCTFTGRYYGILMYVDGCTNNIIQNNDLSGSVGYAISEQTAESPSHSNRYINNDCSGSNVGFAISNPAEVAGNNLNSCVLALSFSGYDPATWALTVSDILDGVDLNGSRRAIHLSNVAAGTVIEGLDFSGMDLVNALEVSYSDNITLQNLVVPASNDGLYLYGVTNSTIRSVTCTGEGSRGIEMRACDGNTIENSTFTGRYYGILMYVDGCTNNIIQNNDLSGSVGYAISEQTAGSPSHSNRYINNDCSGSNVGFAISNPAEVTGNNLNSCVLALYIAGYDSQSWALSMADILDGVDLNGSQRGLGLVNVAPETIISDLDLSGATLARALEVTNSDNITLRDLDLSGPGAGLFLHTVTNSTISGVSSAGPEGGGGTGIEMRGCNHNTIEGSVLSGRYFGIYMNNLPCAENAVFRNTFADNTYGLYVNPGSGNRFTNNVFDQNTVHAYVNPESVGNVFSLDTPIGGNHWSDWTEPDVDGDGFVDAPYVFTGGVDNLPWASAAWPANYAPVADAGPDQTVLLGEQVQLDGTGSSDPDADPICHHWVLLSKPEGSSAGFIDACVSTYLFYPDLKGTYVIQLTVNDGELHGGPDEMVLTVTTLNEPPVADAGEDQAVFVDNTVSLNGSTSSDPDEDPLTFDWSIDSAPAGSLAELVDADTGTPSLVPDLPGDYVVELIVNDGTEDSAADQVTVTARTTQQAAEDVIADVEALINAGTLNKGNGNALLSKLENVIKKLDKGNENAAANQLGAFINQINSFIQSGKLTAEEGQPLIDAAEAIIAHLGVPLAKAVAVPSAFSLSPAHPNPFNPATTIRYALLEASNVRLVIYNVLGQQVRVLASEQQDAGFHELRWDGRDGLGREVSSGVYLYRLQAEKAVAVQKMVLAR